MLALRAGRIDRRMLRSVFLSSARSTAMVMLILTAAFLLNSAFAILGIPSAVSKAVVAMELTPATTSSGRWCSTWSWGRSWTDSRCW